MDVVIIPESWVARELRTARLAKAMLSERAKISPCSVVYATCLDSLDQLITELEMQEGPLIG